MFVSATDIRKVEREQTRPGRGRLTLVLRRVRTAFGRRRKIAVALMIVWCLAATAAAQRARGGFGGGRFARLEPNAPYDGAFRFCRIMFRQNPYGDGNGWSVDYPRADINLS